MKKALILKTISVVIDSVVVSVDLAVDWRRDEGCVLGKMWMNRESVVLLGRWG